MKDSEIDRLLGEVQPTPVPAGALAEAGRELLEEIMSVHSPAEPGRSDQAVPLPTRTWSLARRRLAWVGVAAAVVAAVVVPTVVFGGGGAVVPVTPATQAPTPTPQLPHTKNPYVLLDAPGWEIDHVNESAEDNGEISFQQPETGQSLQVSWTTMDAYESRYEDRLDVSDPEPITLFGANADRFDYGKGEFEVLAPQSDIFLEVRGSSTGGRKNFAGLLEQLRQVPAEEWFAAMPDSVITPDENPSYTEEILAGVPLPEGLPASAFVSGFTNSRYHVEFGVIQRATCAWLENYEQAWETDDEPAMAAADQALAGSPNWEAVRREDGPDPIGAEQYVKAVSQRKSVDGYRSNLGCDDLG
ncbi:hypothetical protein [Kineosporia babensis]|uniref:Uncharacterized protein n=1 Tax=Kineosporia babensis TaxID=499548 RepID=A0A9X1N944_9ACTN|nr:hypothetical protein [Kineosporia babensis]MCD5309450.1 hypothetical protein [Kineosporia babensis]